MGGWINGWVDGWMGRGMDGWMDDEGEVFAVAFRQYLSVRNLVFYLESLLSLYLREVYSFILISNNLYLPFRKPHLQSTSVDLSLDFITFLLQANSMAHWPTAMSFPNVWVTKQSITSQIVSSKQFSYKSPKHIRQIQGELWPFKSLSIQSLSSGVRSR